MSGSEAALAVMRCRACNAVAAWPRHACIACGSTDREADVAVGSGHIHSVTVIHRPPTTDGADQSPYAVALIELDIGGKLMARVPIESRIDDRVVLQRQSLRAMPGVVAAWR